MSRGLLLYQGKWLLYQLPPTNVDSYISHFFVGHTGAGENKKEKNTIWWNRGENS